ncbi:MAG: transporter substrate-binding domain-containing protein [Planctomycetota bacterium]|jgi:polar amino acid transport system substrate-binding protein|nr:transporter substrate-binding domain-containing protein [Planctomycetota bacterium]
MRTLVLCVALLLASPLFGADKLIMATQEFAPFHYMVDDKPSGPGVDIILAAAAKADLPCEVQLLPWRRAQEEAKNGRVHGLFLLGKNAEREQWLSFTTPILTTEYGLFTRIGSDWTYEDAESLRDRTIAVYGPSNTANSLEKIKAQLDGSVKIEMRPDDEAGFRKLNVGRVDGVYSNKAVGLALVRKLKLEHVAYGGIHKPVKYYAALSTAHTDAATVEAFNAAMAAIVADGTVAQIISKYGMQDDVVVGAAD